MYVSVSQVMNAQILLVCTIAGYVVSCEQNFSNGVGEDFSINSSSSSQEGPEELILTIPQTMVDIRRLRFIVYTRRNKEIPYELRPGDKLNLIGSPFNRLLPTKVLIHGWQSSFNAERVQRLKNALLDAFNANILIFDYKAYNQPYISAVSRSESIGRRFAEFMQFLIKSHAMRPETVHIIGHSLGGHIAGFVGKNVYPKLGRITALDPAGLFFFDRTPEHRLSRTDAVYVDVIHTSTLAGINKPIGVADFFVNGGSNQPMCLTSPLVGGCDHLSGFEYYRATLVNRNAFPARQCATENEARVPDPSQNTCRPSSAVMGEDAIYRSPPGIYYVPTDR